MRVSFHPEARHEAEQAQSWYEERSLLAAAGFLHELSVARRISEAPHRYPVALHGTGRILLDRFPFSIYYRIADDELVVVAVAHQKRRPGYWTSR